MNLWIIHQNATPPTLNGLPRSYFLARELIERGHSVVVIASSFNHRARVQLLDPGETMRLERCDGVDFLWLRSSAYKGNTVRRLWNMLQFGWRVWRLVPKAGLGAPDVILGSTPSPLGALAAQRLAVRHRTPFVLEVRDLWPQTLIDLGGFSARNPVVRALLSVERRLYQTADRIVSLLPNAAEHMVEKGAAPERIVWIPNGIALQHLAAPTRPLDDGVFTVLYAGAHGIANGLDTILDAAALLQKDPRARNVRLRFVGDGAEKPRLVRRAREEGLTNVSFEGAVPNASAYAVLAEADAFIANLRASPLYRFGVSPNKFFDYMAMARPTVVAISAFNNPIAEAGAGLTVPADDAAALAQAIVELAAMSPAERWEMGLRGRRYVEAHHDFVELGKRLETVLAAALQMRRDPCPPRERALLSNGSP